MRKSNQRPLKLSTQTVRVLTGDQLASALGGLSDPGQPGSGDPGQPGSGDPGRPGSGDPGAPIRRPNTTH